jgi:alkylation response protein AidB-like acyl-CoA dehydrogenase
LDWKKSFNQAFSIYQSGKHTQGGKMSILNEEQMMIRDTARELASKVIAPIAASVDREDNLPKSIISKIAEVGLIGMSFPDQFGGIEADTLSWVICLEEIARASGACADFLATQHSCSSILLHWGSDAQKHEFLPAVASGDTILALALTEADAGSDISAVRTTARRDKDEYILNGVKSWVSFGAIADGVITLVVTEPDNPRHENLSLILSTDFERGKKEDLLGTRGIGVTEIIFDESPTPSNFLIGSCGKGFTLIQEALAETRLGAAAISIGLAQAALDESLAYAVERSQYGKPIALFEGIQFMLADMATQVEAARALTYQAARLKDNDQSFARIAAEAKLFASNTAMSIAIDALQIHGAYGYSKDYAIERILRDAKKNQIYAGTNQIQKLVIARDLISNLKTKSIAVR